MADIEKLVGSESPLEVGQKINEIIENGGGGGLEIGDIGIAPLGIDETKGKRRYLNGQVIIQEQYVQFTNKVKSAVALYPSLACTESEWQATALLTVGGQVGKFVVDDDAGTIRLPKIIMPIQGLTDLSKLGEIVEAGLPNITGDFTIYSNPNGAVTAGAFTKDNGPTSRHEGGTGTGTRYYFDASRSSSIYGNSNTVQQEQIQYPYFIQVATGVETEDNIVNEIELNNPFSLLDYKYSEYELNNLSWLRSQGQYNSKITYPAVYDLLLKIYNGTETKVGVSVKLSTDTSATEYDFRINTTEETFMLPTKVKQKFYNAVSGNFPVVGNGKTLGVTNGSKNGGLYYSAGSVNSVRINESAYGTNVGTSYTSASFDDKLTIGITTDPTKSGLVAKLSSTEVSDLYLYFYVGETVQNANLINAGRIEEKVATLISDNMNIITSSGFPSNKSVTLTIGASGSLYVAPANGWFILNCQTQDTATTSNRYVALDNYSTGMTDMRWFTNATNLEYSGFVPAKKGETVALVYSGSLALNSWGTGFKFIYAEGDK